MTPFFPSVHKHITGTHSHGKAGAIERRVLGLDPPIPFAMKQSSLKY